MNTYRISYSKKDKEPEDVQAEGYRDEGNQGQWIDFYIRPGLKGETTVLRVKADDVERIEVTGTT